MNRAARLGSVCLGVVLASTAAVSSGCSSKGSSDSERDAGSRDAESSSRDGGVVVTSDDGGPTPVVGTIVGQLDASPTDAFAPLPLLTNVVVTEREDSVGIDFDPVDDAIDYRVYPLPSPGDVTTNADGSLTIPNAVYRCAGLRQTWDLPNGVNNPIGVVPDGGQAYYNLNEQFSWGAQILPNPTLGYVQVTAGDGLVPVYAIGVHPTDYELGWRESRPKIYTTDATLRASLLTQGGRDDGIVFYVPSAASATTETVYHSETATNVGSYVQYVEYYFTSGDLAAHGSDTTAPAAAFQIQKATSPGAQPLMGVFYQAGQQHIELAVGKERYKRASNQGQGPLWHVEWAPITGPTTLVVEALASGCPFQGFLSPESVDAPPHQPLLTLAQMQKAAPNGEVFVNGQYDLPGTTFTILTSSGTGGGVFAVTDAASPQLATPNSSPVPIARSFVQVVPQPHDPSAWDWYQGFNVDSTLPQLTPSADTVCNCTVTSATPCISGGGACGYWTSSVFNVGGYDMDDPSNVPLFAYGQFGGQMWDAFDDVYQDVTGSVRMSVPETISLNPNEFLHLTWSVDIVGTHRRYPQVLITDQGFPVEDSFSNPNNDTLILQTFASLGPSMQLEAEAFHGLVNGAPWAVNNQAPNHAFVDYDNWTMDTNMTLQPIIPIFEHAGMDRMTKFDAYVSSSLVYMFVDGFPAGCTQYPTTGGFALSGKVQVTFGDVLYHEGASDEMICLQEHPFLFMHEHQCTETKRHWDDLGLKNGVPAPSWDNARFPCLPY